MKFTLAIVTGFLAAVSSAKPTPKEVDILLNIQVQDNNPVATINTHKVSKTTNDFGTTKACLMVCWPEEHKCPASMESAQFGECWTCCITDSMAAEL